MLHVVVGAMMACGAAYPPEKLLPFGKIARIVRRMTKGPKIRVTVRANRPVPPLGLLLLSRL
jgi:hypothetical protein